MKYINRITLGLLIGVCMVSCADDARLDFDVTKPASVINTEYLDRYESLKTYVDRAANPNFKLGSGVSLGDYNKKGLIYRLVNSNYDEIVAGYAMKHGAVVQANGTLNLADVVTFLANAEAAGVAVYGHTLVWHANQNAAYLNNLIAPEIIPGDETGLDPSVITNSDFETNIDGWGGWGNNSTRGRTEEGEGYGGGYGFWFTNPSETNSWQAQIAYDFSTPLEENETYVLNFKVKADKSGSISASIQNPSDYSGRGDFGSFDISTQWKEYSLKTLISGDNAARFLFNYGNFAGTVYIDDITLCRENPDGGGTGGTAGYALYVHNPSVTEGYWGVQSLYQLSGVENGATYELSFMIKGDANGTIRPELQRGSDYSSNSFGSVAVTKEWVKHTLTTNVDGDDRDRFIISYGEFAGSLLIDDISICKVNTNGAFGSNLIANGDFENGTAEGWGGWGNDVSIRVSNEGEGYSSSGSIIEKTPEEKEAILSEAMETWIASMMDACKYVKAWDVVNEPMSDWPDPSQLKTGIGKEDMADDEFYWQDYLGKDYAVKAFNLARQYGNSGDILFINDYGLEAKDQKKCKGLIEYVKYIEEKGAKVDGIGTQMHVTCGRDSIESIREMFKNLAATGKMIKVSELDMGYKAAGSEDNIKTSDMTEVQHKEMASFYEKIVKAYFELIPAPQRYGITHWSPTDSPESSYWRAGEPIGLWSLDYNRKHTYGGFANGLAGKDLSK